MRREYTATVYIVKDSKILLHLHQKFKKWMPPGGHLEENELPHEAAIREALEETGLRIELLHKNSMNIDLWNARSIPKPYHMLLENIPSCHEKPEHQHIDMIYVGSTEDDIPIGQNDCRWFSLKEIISLVDDYEIFTDTKIIAQILLEDCQDR